MTEKQLREARFLESDIYQLEGDIEDITKILADYSNFGSTIEFKRNKDSFSRSFGSKKNNFKEPLRTLLESLLATNQIELKKLKEKFKKL